MTDLRVPVANPAELFKDHLALYVGPKFSGLTFGLRLDPKWTTDSAPALVVFDDSGPIRWPVETKPTLRVTVWSGSLSLSRRIASYALGVGLSKRIAAFANVLPGTAVMDDRDTSNGGIMAGFTVRARVRTTLVPEP